MKLADLDALVTAGTVLSNVVFNLGQNQKAMLAFGTTADSAAKWVKDWDRAVRRARSAKKAPRKPSRSSKGKRRG